MARHNNKIDNLSWAAGVITFHREAAIITQRLEINQE